MRTLPLLAILLPCALFAQAPQPSSKLASTPPAQIQSDLNAALLGNWTGFLEYRDYSQPDDSTERVQLPTWLTIASVPNAADPNALTEHFIYDDGPTKVVDETVHLLFNVTDASYRVTSSSGRTEIYKVAGLDTLTHGRGSLIITGPTIDNGRPAETRILLTIRRNLIAWTEENRPTATAPYVFRHRYLFTRAQPPNVTAAL